MAGEACAEGLAERVKRGSARLHYAGEERGASFENGSCGVRPGWHRMRLCRRRLWAW
jgi:hypothetical protein